MLEAIKQWAFTLVITAVVGGIANYFVISDNGNMKKYVKFACSAVALAVMIMPVKELFREMPSMFNLYDYNMTQSEKSEIYEDDYMKNMEQINQLTIAKTNELLKERIYDIVYEKTGIKSDDVYIYIRQKDNKDKKDNAEVGVEKIIINIPEDIDGNKMNETKKIEEVKIYLKQLFNCDVDVGEKTNE